MSTRIVLHDYFHAPDGGGRLALVLARGLGADLGYGYRQPGHPFFKQSFEGRERSLGCRPLVPLLRQIALMRAWRDRAGFAGEYDLAVYSGAYAPLAVLRGGARRNVLYCHTPPRFLYDEREAFEAMAPLGARWAMRAFTDRLRPLYEQAVRGMDVVLANSEVVRGRIRDDLGLEAEVVHPPCDTGAFAFAGQDDYYLSFARLDELKRVDRVVRAFMDMPDRRLVVASDGPMLGELRRLAAGAPNIEILGAVDEARLRELLGRAVASIYVPRNEDFGMSAVESMAAGKPVLGVREGGLTETVLHGETGLLINPRCQPQDIAAAVCELTPARALIMRGACEARASEFGVERFLQRMREVIRG